jgi:hypothetical protein
VAERLESTSDTCDRLGGAHDHWSFWFAGEFYAARTGDLTPGEHRHGVMAPLSAADPDELSAMVTAQDEPAADAEQFAWET